MSGPWERFTPAAAVEEGPWSKFAPPPSDATSEPPAIPKQDVDLPTRAGMALNRTIAGVVGAPVDAATWAINKAGRGVQALTGEPRRDVITNPIGGSESIKKGISAVGDAIGVNTNPDSPTPATTLPQKIAEGIGEGVGMAVLPGLGAEAVLARSLSAADSIGTLALNILKGTGAASNAAMGGVGGAVGVVAEEAAPEPWKPLARMGGEIAGGGVTALLESGGRAAWQGAGNAVRSNVENPNVAAARKILESTEPRKPGDEGLGIRQQVDEYVETGPMVPGSEPTMFQLTGDKKLGELERTVRTQNPGAYTDVLERQAVARTGAVNSAVPEGDTDAVTNLLRTRLDEIKAGHAAERAALEQNAEGRLGEAGGTQFGSQAEADYGAGLERGLGDIDKAKKKPEDATWTALREAAGNKAIPFDGVTKGVADIESSVGRLAEKPAGREKAIYDTIRGEGAYVTFNDITDIRSRITTVLREDKELTGQARGRLSEALRIVDGALDAEAERVAADPTARTELLKKLGLDGLTAEDVELYGQARALTRERKATMGEGTVGEVVEGRVAPSLVPGKLLKRPEDMRAFVAAAGDSPETLKLAQDALAFDMRKEAVKDGLLSPQKLQGWMEKNAEAMRQFPELRAKFENASVAQETLDAAIINQKQALEQFQTTAVKKFLADKESHAALDQAMNTPEAFRELVATVRQDPAALAGLKRLAVELILRKGGVVAEDGTLAGAKEAGTSGDPQLAANAVQKFFVNRRGLLAELFDETELKNIAAVTADMQRAARTVKIPDQSNSMQDMPGVLGGFARGAWNRAGGTMLGGTGAGLMTLDPVTAVVGAAVGKGVDSWRTYYQGRVDKALADMMLDPKVFAIWAPKVKEAAPSENTVARKIRAVMGQQLARELERTDDE